MGVGDEGKVKAFDKALEISEDVGIEVSVESAGVSSFDYFDSGHDF